MRTAITRVNPLVLLGVGGLSFLGSLFVRDLTIAIVTLSAYALVALLVLPSWRLPLVCLGFSAFAALTVLYSNWRLGSGGWEPAATQALRMVILAWPGAVAICYLDTGRLPDYLAQSLHVPARLAAAFGAGLQRFSGLQQAWVELERSRRARGFGPTRNPLTQIRHWAGMTFALMVHALRGATRSSIAMDARGFATAHGRTWAEPAVWTRTDVVALLVAGALGLLPAVLLLASW